MRVLIVEDCPLTAHELAAQLGGAGYEIIATAAAACDAIRILQNCVCDAAVLDANLAGSSSVPVATALISRKIPFVVVSGYAPRWLPSELRAAPFVPKPVTGAALHEAFSFFRDGAVRKAAIEAI